MVSSPNPERFSTPQFPALPPFPPPFGSNKPEEEGGGIRQFLAVVQRRIFLIASVGFAISSVMIWRALNAPESFQGNFQILVEPVKSSDKLAGLTEDGSIATKDTVLDYATQIQILTSPETLGKIFDQPDERQQYRRGKLTINQKGETKILDVRYQADDPKIVQFVLNELAVGYLRYSLQEQQTNLRQGLQFVNEQLPQLLSRVDTLQTRLERFRQQYDFIEPDTQAQNLSAQLNTLVGERQEIEKQLVDLRARYAILQENGGSSLTESESYQQLIGQVRQLETQIALEQSRYRTNSDVIQDLLSKRQNVLVLVQQEAERVLGTNTAQIFNEVRLLELKLEGTTQAEAQARQQLAQMPAIVRRYTELQQELNIANDSLNRFLEKRESLQIKGAETEVPWQVLAPPNVAKTPTNLPKDILMGILGGLACGVGAALLIEKIDDVFYTVEDIQEKVKLPILGAVPSSKKLNEWHQLVAAPQVNPDESVDSLNSELTEATIPYVLGYNFLSFLESFRTLSSNIGFLSSDVPIKSFVVSSPVQNDGKSTVAVHLAQAAAAMSRRVLLVDANLRLPQIHNQFGLENEIGLSSLINTDLNPQAVIQTLPRWDNLSVLTSGPTPPDPTKLLSSNKMRNLMEQFRTEYDWVIYDTPACLDLVDSRIIAPQTDGLLLVVRLKKTEKTLLKETIESLNLSRHNVLGLVANYTPSGKSLSNYLPTQTKN
ncbi:MAG: polysaccharide biosynthesis tyrosine autokinase [Oscillatoriales cyanobacterium RM1_1_9]|nr:polysaccharide biosynthesis tyrosine autokinase [Oscillatoriales cyanobacterium RM2_1_1]NJO71580.1 polysaccharide biosynthesis tyrosine autokinase [Oscillatoriales cyanobacterium RM1_1_9]